MSRQDLILARGAGRKPRTYGRIKLKVAEMAEKRGLTVPSGPFEGQPNATALTRGTTLSYTTIWPMMRHPERLTRINLDTLAQLCAMLDCQPGDLLEYEPPSHETTAPLSEQYKKLAEGDQYFTPDKRA